MHRVCCCGGCPIDCCAFWACSPTTPIDITLSGTSTITDVCDDGEDRLKATAAWTITATMTRSGTDCETYRYSATSCELTATWVQYTYTQSLGSVCDAPPAPCQYDHCNDCQCEQVKRAICTTKTYTFSGTINGVTSPANPACLPTIWNGYHVSGAVLTIFCEDSPCSAGCAEPILMFTPGDNCETSGCGAGVGCIDVSWSITCGTENCCGVQPECNTSGTEQACLGCWSIVGTGCLNGLTFDNARKHPVGPALGDSPFVAIDPTSMCASGGVGPAVVPLDCNSYTFDSKVCDWCSHTNPDVLYQCSQVDLGVPEGYSFLCDPQPLCCSTRVSQALTWNLV